MAIVLPPSVAYQNPVNSVPALFNSTPPEGARIVPIEIDWGSMGGANNCVSINLYGGAAATISQIVAISIDNSQCAADVQFIFPDTAQSYTVSAYAPNSTFTVFTNATGFYVYAPNAESSDVSRFAILNTLPPPVALPLSIEQETAVFNDILIATGTTQLIPTGVNGTLEFVSVNALFDDAPSNVMFVLQDGSPTPKVIAGGQASAVTNNNNANVNALNVGPIAVRFQNGISIVQTQTGETGRDVLTINLFYRTP